MIPYGRQSISEEDIQEVVNTLRSDFLTQGPKVPAFEQAVAEYCGAEHAVAVNSATSALHIACLALGLGDGDILWTSPISFVASANCGIYCGASVDFVDIDPNTANMCPEALEAKLIEAQKLSKLPSVVVAVHLAGQPCQMRQMKRLSKEYGFSLIEDASHAIGGKYDSSPIGSCSYSDVTIFSFHPVKVLTSAEGGMAVTNSEELSSRMHLLRSHGITRDKNLMTKSAEGSWYYQQVDLGFNYRMSDLHAALGLSQLGKLDQFVEKRHALAKRYDELLKSLPIEPLEDIGESYSGRHLYIIKLKLEEITATRQEIFDAMREKGVGVNVHYIPIHTQPFYEKLGFSGKDFPQSEAYYQCALSLPLYPDLAEKDQDKVVQALTECLNEVRNK